MSKNIKEPKKNKVNFPSRPKSTQICSEALYSFLRRYELIFDFFFFGISVTTRMDKQREIAIKTLASTSEGIEKEKYENQLKSGDSTFKELQKFSTLQSENMCIRISDNFMSFISESIKSTMLARPEL